MSSNEQIQEIIDRKKNEIQILKDENTSIREKKIKSFSDEKKVDENNLKISKLKLEITKLEEQKKKNV